MIESCKEEDLIRLEMQFKYYLERTTRRLVGDNTLVFAHARFYLLFTEYIRPPTKSTKRG
jgi:hypothetical protein